MNRYNKKVSILNSRDFYFIRHLLLIYFLGQMAIHKGQCYHLYFYRKHYKFEQGHFKFYSKYFNAYIEVLPFEKDNLPIWVFEKVGF